MTTTKTTTHVFNGIDCTVEIHVSDYGPDSPDAPIAWVEGYADADHDEDSSVVTVQLWAASVADADTEATAEIVRAVLDAATAELARRGIL